MGAEADFDEAQSDLRWLADHGALAGVHEVMRERRRQLELGWTPEHDDQHAGGWLIMEAGQRLMEALRDVASGVAGYPETEAGLRISAALLAAEIDRLNRMLAG